MDGSEGTPQASRLPDGCGPLRLAVSADAPALERLISRSVRALQAGDYTAEQLDAALGYVFGVDHQLIADSTYFVIDGPDAPVACGGWSRRRTLFGAQAHAVRDDSELTPGVDAARIRAFFVDPQWARRGLGGRLLHACEEAARSRGFSDFELGATLTGVPLYSRFGYLAVDRQETPVPGAPPLAIVRMVKRTAEPDRSPVHRAP